MVTALALVVSLAAGCRPSGTTTQAAVDEVDVEGAGATFPSLLYSRWIAEYSQIRPEVHIAYEPIGTSGGLRALREGRLDFAGAESWPIEPEVVGDGAAFVPATLGAIVIAYNLPDLPGHLRLTPELVAGIFAGDIRRWNDPRLRGLDPGMPLPDAEISVVHRKDGSGTTALFTEYLAQVVPSWRARFGHGSEVGFPTGRAVMGNEGVAGTVRATPGAIGYMQLAHARRVGLELAAIRNRAGNFVTPSLEAIEAAARHPRSTDADGRTVLLDPEGARSYPIAGYSYFVVPVAPAEPARAGALVAFLWWCVHDGQRLAPALGHAPLPPDAVTAAERAIGSVHSEPR